MALTASATIVDRHLELSKPSNIVFPPLFRHFTALSCRYSKMAAKQLLFYDFLRSSNLDRTAPSRKTENMSTNESHFRQVETLNYRKGGFHPVHLQDQFKKDRYRVIHKLGHGGFATVWLARDVVRHRYVALKILAARLSRDCPEVEILRRLKRGIDLKGKAHVMSMLDHFWISGPNGKHLCVVSEVAGPSIKQFNECPGQWKWI